MCDTREVDDCLKSKEKIHKTYIECRKITDAVPQSEKPYFKHYTQQLISHIEKVEVKLFSSK